MPSRYQLALSIGAINWRYQLALSIGAINWRRISAGAQSVRSVRQRFSAATRSTGMPGAGEDAGGTRHA